MQSTGMRIMRRHRLTGRLPATGAAGVPSVQRRHKTPYMPWPFDTYFRPGAAKYWLSKYPATDATEDEYEKDLVYLDELEERVQNAAKNYQPSERWKAAYNEYNWQTDDHVTETYGSIGGPTSGELQRRYGRGNKIDVSHYLNPRFYKHDRVRLPSPYIHPDMRKRMGPLRNMLSLPPEEPSAFKLWNPYTMFGATAIICVSKEWWLIGHDFWHAVQFWMCWCFIITVCVDWWSWYYALRGQEWYDQTFMPLNEQTKQLFDQLNHLASRPAVGGIFALMKPYAIDLAQRSIDKAKRDKISGANLSAADKLELKLREEQAAKSSASTVIKEKAFQDAMAGFSSSEAKKKYMQLTLKMVAAKAELKPGVNDVKGDSSEFATQYDKSFKSAETDFYKTQREAGTLSWALRNAEEIKKGKPTAASLQQRYAEKLAVFSKKYHPVTVQSHFA